MRVAVKFLLVAVFLSLGVVLVGLRSGGSFTQLGEKDAMVSVAPVAGVSAAPTPAIQRAAHGEAQVATLAHQPPHTVDVSRVHVNKSLPHPSCISEEVLRSRIGETDASGIVKRYARPNENCFKNCGGALVPGEPRMGAPFLTVTDAIFSRGSLHIVAAKSEKSQRLSFAAYFPMISGVWPQPIVADIQVRTLSLNDAARLIRGDSGSVAVVDVGYFQAPTDFLSTYHTVVETVLPAFHRLLDRIAPDPCDVYIGRPAKPTFVVTSRPTTSKYGFKPKSCHIPQEEAVASSSGIGEGAASAHVKTPVCLSTVWGKMFTAMIGGPQFIYGLRPADAQLFDEKLTAKLRSSDTFVFKELRLGNPTTCEPLWGPDPFYAEALAGNQDLNITRAVTRAVGDRTGEWHDRFSPSFSKCQEVMWRFRSFFIGAAAQERELAASLSQTAADDKTWLTSVAFAKPIPTGEADNGAAEPLVVLWATRKGDWARWITNEDEVLSALQRHLDAHFGERRTARRPRLVLRVVRFGGSLWNQVKQLQNVSVFIANHGANILPSVYLRPNAGVITLSFAEPGFYPFAVFPSWLHWRNLLIEQDCNRRLFKGKCKWSTPNNNDMRMTALQIAQLLDALDSIVTAARDESTARRPLHDPAARCVQR